MKYTQPNYRNYSRRSHSNARENDTVGRYGVPFRRNDEVCDGVAGLGEEVQYDEKRENFWWSTHIGVWCRVKKTSAGMREAGEYRMETNWDDLFRYGTRVEMISAAMLALEGYIEIVENTL